MDGCLNSIMYILLISVFYYISGQSVGLCMADCSSVAAKQDK
jgi:hypothetical protein